MEFSFLCQRNLSYLLTSPKMIEDIKVDHLYLYEDINENCHRTHEQSIGVNSLKGCKRNLGPVSCNG